nr:putative ribonuclease H-like domain-containing protein [Tanacetum cinerariifolium]
MFQPNDGFHAVPPPYTRTFMQPKPNLVFNTAPTDVETDHLAFTIKLSLTKPNQDVSLTNRPSPPIIEDQVSDSEDESETKAPQNAPSFVQPTMQVKSPRHSVQHVETFIPAASHKPATPKPTSPKPTILTQSKPVPITIVRPVSTAVPTFWVTRTRHAMPLVPKTKSATRRHINRSPSPQVSNYPPRVTAVKAPMVNDAQVVKGKWEWRPKFPILDHVSRNTSASMTLKRLGHINFKTINKLVKGNLVRGLPTKVFENDNTCVACKKGKQHRASCKTKPVSSIDQPLYRLHMDLFGPTFVRVRNKKSYCLVVTDDYSRFTWVFFLAFKDETSPILKTFIIGLKNQLSLKVKVIKSDNGTEFKNNDLNHFCRMKEIKREFSVPKNLSKMALMKGKTGPSLRLLELCWQIYFYPFHFELRQLILLVMSKIGYSLRKFDGKVDEGFLVGYSPEPEVNVSPSNSAQSKKQDDKTNREAKGKSLVASFTGYKDLSAEFEDCSDNSINKVNAASTLVPTVGQISPNSTNTFKLKEITYSDDEYNVGAEADFNNLETSITVSHIPTTKVHKDHPVTQIISDLSSTTQTRSMTKVGKDQGRLSQMFNVDFHTCMFACFYHKKKPRGYIKLLKIQVRLKLCRRSFFNSRCRRLISWQCKKQTVVATSSTEAEYVATASCCAQGLWIQNQLLDYGKELASLKQTALGKDELNPLMVY